MSDYSIDMFEECANDTVTYRLALDYDAESINFLRDNFNASIFLIVLSYALLGPIGRPEAILNYKLAKNKDDQTARLYYIHGLAMCGDLDAILSILAEIQDSQKNKIECIKQAIINLASHSYTTLAYKLLDHAKAEYDNGEITANLTQSMVEGLGQSDWESGYELYKTINTKYKSIRNDTFQHLVASYIINNPVKLIYPQIKLLKKKFNINPNENIIYVTAAINFAAFLHYDSLKETLAVGKWASPDMLPRMIKEVGHWLPQKGNKQVLKRYLSWVKESYPHIYNLVVNHLIVGCMRSIHQIDLTYLISVIESHHPLDDIKEVLCKILEESVSLNNSNLTL
jgi:hypothetical protein